MSKSLSCAALLLHMSLSALQDPSSLNRAFHVSRTCFSLCICSPSSSSSFPNSPPPPTHPPPFPRSLTLSPNVPPPFSPLLTCMERIHGSKVHLSPPVTGMQQGTPLLWIKATHWLLRCYTLLAIASCAEYLTSYIIHHTHSMRGT